MSDSNSQPWDIPPPQPPLGQKLQFGKATSCVHCAHAVIMHNIAQLKLP